MRARSCYRGQPAIQRLVRESFCVLGLENTELKRRERRRSRRVVDACGRVCVRAKHLVNGWNKTAAERGCTRGVGSACQTRAQERRSGWWGNKVRNPGVSRFISLHFDFFYDFEQLPTSLVQPARAPFFAFVFD